MSRGQRSNVVALTPDDGIDSKIGIGSSIVFEVILPRQSEGCPVFSFVARADDVARIARIERAGRSDEGALNGFQRPQIASHIREIRDYLEKPNAILPNALIVGFTEGAHLRQMGPGRGRLTVSVGREPVGWIVDGQQRFTALAGLVDRDFEVLVSGFICATVEELQRQFILINSTRPLPKALVYELLPKVGHLPPRMSNRSQAALLTEALNYGADSSLRGRIRQQTNPKGVIRDTVLQKVIMASITDGALRLYANDDALLLERGTRLLSEFFHAVRHVFRAEWDDHSPNTSRLLHGAGIQAMGYVMEYLHTIDGAEDRHAFVAGLRPLVGQTAWTGGHWRFEDETRPWNAIENVPRNIRLLSLHLVDLLRRAREGRPQPGAAGVPRPALPLLRVLEPGDADAGDGGADDRRA